VRTVAAWALVGGYCSWPCALEGFVGHAERVNTFGRRDVPYGGVVGADGGAPG
jgi:hypothetical protein